VFEKALALLHTPMTILIATADERLRPHFLRAYGVEIAADRGLVTVFAPEPVAAPTLANLAQRKAIALTIASMEDLTGVQLKGDVIAIKPGGDDANRAIDENQERVAAMMRRHIGEHHAELWKQRVTRPVVAITFAVRDVFNQTPGKGAGARVG
jgi:hypothetical protein